MTLNDELMNALPPSLEAVLLGDALIRFINKKYPYMCGRFEGIELARIALREMWHMRQNIMDLGGGQ